MNNLARFKQIVADAESDTDLATKIEKDPVAVVKQAVAGPAYQQDLLIYRFVVWFLGLALLVAAGGTIVAMITGRDVPAALVAFGSGALGALGGLLAPSPTGKG